MAIQKLTIEEFVQLAKANPVLDVRSPGEYNHAHIPAAHSFPLFTDEERKIVGTAYKQQSREAAIKIGLDFFGTKMKKMVEEAEEIIKNHSTSNTKPQPSNIVLVHCWRGGMRSAGIAWLLDLYGFKVYTLVGGYKAYRKWVLAQFEKQYNFNIVGGYTGSGKTLLLQEIAKHGKPVIDLERIANHKGSAFGALGEEKQPGQEMFENMLAQKLSATENSKPVTENIYIEDESQRIGNVQIPIQLWNTMRRSPIFFVEVPFSERLTYLTEEYGRFEKDQLSDAVLRIQKRLGGLAAKNAINFLEEGNYRECFRILLNYYDKWYTKGLHNRENLASLLNKIPCTSVDTGINAEKLLSCNNVAAS